MFHGAPAAAFDRLRRDVKTVRYGHDGYAYARLAAGSIDLVVESGLKPYGLQRADPSGRGAGGTIGTGAAATILAAARSSLRQRARFTTRRSSGSQPLRDAPERGDHIVPAEAARLHQHADVIERSATSSTQPATSRLTRGQRDFHALLADLLRDALRTFGEQLPCVA